MGLNELDQGGTDEFLNDGECEIELPVVGSGRKRETIRATYNKGPGVPYKFPLLPFYFCAGA